MFGQLADLLDRKEILRFRREVGRERYVKKFDAWHHLLVMLYATIERFDSLCEITINCYLYLEHPEMDRIKRIEEEKDREDSELPIFRLLREYGLAFYKFHPQHLFTGLADGFSRCPDI